ncbi:hypothetical protein QZH56_18605 [Streptomyces olivoreticuli]|uniref:hypothetical protein n=1 Tax=Streptomyces olivoreticuli TaxID=68246 RepID=UPI0026596D7E|nr:hypothetical protein [Streptomyces olivoreticuli]WKK20911.1 hypothetical protein QZH56_18605 [Streptomyces olivoreticuli]
MTDVDTGAWRGSKEKAEDHLELSSEENRLVTSRWEAAKEARGRLDGIMAGVEERSASQGGKLEGLDYSLKGLDSFRRKVAVAVARGRKAEREVQKVDDLNRYTLTFDADTYVQGTQQTYAELRAQGFEPVSEQNTWEDPVYKGVNTAWENRETEEKFELQFHTPESFQAKSENHELYELARSGTFEQFNSEKDPKRSESYQEASDLLQNERYENVRVPPGVEELEKRTVRATLNPDVDPEVVEHVRQMEADLRATHAAAAKAAEPQQSADGLGESLGTGGPGLRDRLAAKTGPVRQSNARSAPAADPLPTQSRGRGRSMA